MAQPEGRLVDGLAPPQGRAAAMQRQRQRAESALKNFEWTWTSAVIFSLGLVFFILISIAVIPSFWLYYADQKLKWDGGAPHKILPFLPWTLDGFWLKELRDAVAMGLSTGPLITVLVAGAILQNWRRKLRGAQSDTRPTGGYR
jgi:cbb3-type cytochrome oxidase subunit 3